uniref:Uncharacterized protein n=1 Tax=Myoviridae sp. ctIty1 TaxID=2827673 RepID=A0A8S5TH91_9CAUD|nr:MAG TPA: hypothetical protein [Myoviridae sp. ctIty1]
METKKDISSGLKCFIRYSYIIIIVYNYIVF